MTRLAFDPAWPPVPSDDVRAEDDYCREPERARRHLASLPAEYRARLHAEWNDNAQSVRSEKE